MMPVIIMGGIYGGVFTPTEAGGVGCLYALIVGIFVFKKMTFKQAFKSFIDTGSSLGSILIMMPMTLMFSRILVVNDVPQMVTTLITSISTNRTVILLIIDFIIFAAGFFLDAGILLLLFTPLLLPTAVMIGLSQVTAWSNDVRSSWHRNHYSSYGYESLHNRENMQSYRE